MNKMTVFTIIFSLLVVSGFVWLIKDSFFTQDAPPVFSMSDQFVYNKMLFIRREVPNGNLLLKLLNEKKVIRYDLQTQKISEVDENAWNTATEKITTCNDSSSIGENESGKYDAYGKYTLAANVSPDEKKIAVVSAYGPKVPTIAVIPFMGGSGYRILGQRYLEIKENSANYSTLDKPFRLGKASAQNLCWTNDSNLVVLYDNIYFVASVFNFNPQAAAPSVPQKPTEQVPAKPDLSKLIGVVNDYGIDADGDGLIEKIAVEAETETTVPGKYKILLSIESANGKHYGEMVETDLKGGIEKTKLFFDTQRMFDEKAEGVFKINFLQFIYGEGLMLEQRENVGQTREYKLSQFMRPNIVYTGENKVTPIDKNRNSKYEGLQIEIGMDVLHPGDYEFQGDLYDEFSTDTGTSLVEFGESSAKLNKGKGKVTFFFSGKKIIEHGVSGRFQLKNVYGYIKGTESETMAKPYFTQRFDVSQFESED